MRLNLRRDAVQWARSGLTLILAGMVVLAVLQIALFVRALSQTLS